MYAAEGAPLADLRRPQDRPVVVRVESPDRAGLLADYQYLLAVGSLDEHRRHADVEIRAGRIRTVPAARPRTARHAPGVFRRRLEEPGEFTGLDVECDDRVAGCGGGTGIVLPRSGVDKAARGVNRGAGPSGR